MDDKPAEVRRLAAYGSIPSALLVRTLEDVEGVELTITDFTLDKGDFGQYAYIYATDLNGELYTIRTGAFLILGALKDAKEQGALPVVATFKKRGQTWMCD